MVRRFCADENGAACTSTFFESHPALPACRESGVLYYGMTDYDHVPMLYCDSLDQLDACSVANDQATAMGAES